MVSSKRETREPQSEMKPEMSKLIDIKECKKTRIAVKLKQSPKDLILEKKKKRKSAMDDRLENTSRMQR